MTEFVTINVTPEIRAELKKYAASLSRHGEHVPAYVAIASLLDERTEEPL